MRDTCVARQKFKNNSLRKIYSLQPSLILFSLYQIRNLKYIKPRNSSVNVDSVFVFTIIYCYHKKILFTISNFLKIDKSIVSNWYQNLDDRLIREFKINISQILVVAKGLHFKKLKETYKDKTYKEEVKGVHDNASAFIEK